MYNLRHDQRSHPQHFIGEPIEVIFDQPPTYEKKPPCPNDFVWQGQTYRIVEELESWHDYERKGPHGNQHATRLMPKPPPDAARGAWAVSTFACVWKMDDCLSCTTIARHAQRPAVAQRCHGHGQGIEGAQGRVVFAE